MMLISTNHNSQNLEAIRVPKIRWLDKKKWWYIYTMGYILNCKKNKQCFLHSVKVLFETPIQYLQVPYGTVTPWAQNCWIRHKNCQGDYPRVESLCSERPTEEEERRCLSISCSKPQLFGPLQVQFMNKNEESFEITPDLFMH